MSLILSGTDGLSDVDGSAATPAIRGTDANTGIFFPAADTIAFSEGGVEAMRIDSSGNVGIGTASPSYKIDAVATDGIFKFTKSGGASGYLLMGGSSANLSYDTSGNYAWGVASTELQAWTAGTKRMVIDSSGNVGIGTSSPAERLHVAGGCVQVTGNLSSVNRPSSAVMDFFSGNTRFFSIGSDSSTSGGFIFQTSTTTTNTERMRIDTSGNLLVGTTGQIGTEKIGVEQTSTTGQAVYCYAANASYAGNVIVVNTARAASTAFTSIATYSAGVNQFYVGGTGLIYSVQLAGGATTLSVNASGQIIRTPSDASLKTNIQPITYGLDTVMKLKPVKHEWVEEINMGAPSIGFIAQDMELEVPEVVSGEEYKSIDYPKLTAVLTKAIQEQQALIQTLTDRITALEEK